MTKVIGILFLIFSFICSPLQAQNLVSNGDFESNTGCQSLVGNFNCAPPWVKEGIPRYYHPCSQAAIFGVPLNLGASYQWPHSGSAYVGINTYGYYARDYIWQKLLDTLQKDKEYCVEFYVSLANISRCGSDAFGAYFSDTSVACPTLQCLLPFIPQVSSVLGVPIIDTLNWTKISGRFVATGGECYLTIGNFLPDSSTTTQVIDSTTVVSTVYYIDDVSVSLCDSTSGISAPKSKELILLHPNPAVDFVELDIKSNLAGLFTLFDVQGKCRYEQVFDANSHSMDLQQVIAGLYFYQISINDANVQSGKLAIMR